MNHVLELKEYVLVSRDVSRDASRERIRSDASTAVRARKARRERRKRQNTAVSPSISGTTPSTCDVTHGEKMPSLLIGFQLTRREAETVRGTGARPVLADVELGGRRRGQCDPQPAHGTTLSGTRLLRVFPPTGCASIRPLCCTSSARHAPPIKRDSPARETIPEKQHF